ncbi:hypothetical protein ABPG75_009094 [Micractinium tetrahymenae]
MDVNMDAAIEALQALHTLLAVPEAAALQQGLTPAALQQAAQEAQRLREAALRLQGCSRSALPKERAAQLLSLAASVSAQVYSLGHLESKQMSLSTPDFLHVGELHLRLVAPAAEACARLATALHASPAEAAQLVAATNAMQAVRAALGVLQQHGEDPAACKLLGEALVGSATDLVSVDGAGRVLTRRRGRARARDPAQRPTAVLLWLSATSNMLVRCLGLPLHGSVPAKTRRLLPAFARLCSRLLCEPAARLLVEAAYCGDSFLKHSEGVLHVLLHAAAEGAAELAATTAGGSASRVARGWDAADVAAAADALLSPVIWDNEMTRQAMLRAAFDVFSRLCQLFTSASTGTAAHGTGKETGSTAGPRHARRSQQLQHQGRPNTVSVSDLHDQLAAYAIRLTPLAVAALRRLALVHELAPALVADVFAAWAAAMELSHTVGFALRQPDCPTICSIAAAMQACMRLQPLQQQLEARWHAALPAATACQLARQVETLEDAVQPVWGQMCFAEPKGHKEGARGVQLLSSAGLPPATAADAAAALLRLHALGCQLLHWHVAGMSAAHLAGMLAAVAAPGSPGCPALLGPGLQGYCSALTILLAAARAPATCLPPLLQGPSATLPEAAVRAGLAAGSPPKDSTLGSPLLPAALGLGRPFCWVVLDEARRSPRLAAALVRSGLLADVLAAAASLGHDKQRAEKATWQPSSHVCPPPVVPGVTAASPRTCTFRNLYLWRGRAHYVAEGPLPDLSKLGLDFELWRPSAGSRVGPATFVTVVSPARFSALLASAGGSVPGAGSTAGLGRIPIAYFWRARKVLSDAVHGAVCDGQSTVPGKSNYYHFLAEHMPILSMSLCEQFGHCSQVANRSGLQIIDVTRGALYPCQMHQNYPPFYQEAIACLSDRPLLHLNGSTLRDRLTLVDTAWMGLGPRCRGIVDGCYPKKGGAPPGPRLPPTPALMAAWRRVLGQCFGFDPEAAAPLHPVRLLLVDRLYESGRHINNIATVLRALRSRFSPQQVQVQVEYMEGLSIRQQARLCSQATVLIHMHGAATGNLPFLPKGAQVVLLGPIPRRWPPLYGNILARDLEGVTDIALQYYANPDARRVQLLAESLADVAAAHPEVEELLANRTFMADFQTTFDCPPGRLMVPCRDWLQRQMNVALPPEVLVNMSEAAIEAAFRHQGQRWVPAPGGGATGGADGHAAHHAPLAPPLRPSRLPFVAAAASGACLLMWLAVLRPMLAAR